VPDINYALGDNFFCFSYFHGGHLGATCDHWLRNLFEHIRMAHLRVEPTFYHEAAITLSKDVIHEFSLPSLRNRPNILTGWG
jgi:hypothetical protein